MCLLVTVRVRDVFDGEQRLLVISQAENKHSKLAPGHV